MLATHNLAEAQELCDRVAVLEHGRLLAIGTTDELARRTVASGLMVETHPDDLAEVADVCRHWGRVTVRDDAPTVDVAGVAHDDVPALVSSLTGAGHRVYAVHPVEPSLEDVYFALHGSTKEAP